MFVEKGPRHNITVIGGPEKVAHSQRTAIVVSLD